MNTGENLVFLTLAALLSAGLTILGYYLRPPRRALIYVSKPLATILILLIAVLPGTVPADPYALAISLGLGFSLLGDIWAMLSRRHFLKALISFLITHVCYALAFLAGGPAAGFLRPVVPVAILGAAILAYLWPALSAGMKAAVGAYVGVIVVMVALAAGRALASFSPDALIAAIGAFLFLASDSVLAVNRFRRPFYAAQAVILGSYFAGQLLIALSVGLRTYSQIRFLAQ
ncbi:MAG: lysoplasmalogenase [Anaerolineales bacterium]|nr:lysoplasmalogenase [Anaerolineales bacterium]